MDVIFKKEARNGFLFLCVLLTGCASVDSNDYKQTVRVTSDPPGAVIYDRGVKIGVTPAFVRVRRRKNPELSLKFPGNDERVLPLTKHYRWGDSFAMNLLVWTFAPIGWTVDLATGVAWKMDDPPMQHFEGQPVAEKARDVIALAPPEAIDTETSDTIGGLLEKKVGTLGEAWILNYKDTAPLFDYYGSDHGLTTNPKLRYNLYYQLRANKIFVSKVEAGPEGFLVTGHLHDTFTGDDGATRSWLLASDDDSLKDQVSEHHFFNEYFHLLPNTVFVNLANYTPAIEIDRHNYTGSSAREHSFWNDMVDAINFIGLEHLERPRSNVKGHFTFGFVPVVNASQAKISFNNYKPLEGIEYDRTYINGGYGLEVGHLSRVGFFYLDYVPVATYTRIHAFAPGNEMRIDRYSVQTVTELGYNRFFTDHLVARAFIRSVAEDSNLWQNVIRRTTHSDEVTGNVSSAYVGVGLGYYLPSSLNRKNTWKVVDKK